MIEYVISKYGADHVAQIVTFGTMAAKAAIRDVGRVMGMPYATVDAVAKAVPFDLGITLSKALDESHQLYQMYVNDEQVRKLVDMAMKIEGMPRHTSTHAAGVVITKDPVDKYVPLAKNDEAVVTQYTMTTLDELGLLKIDFLGLRNLTIIDDTVKMINKSCPKFSIDDIPLDDQEVFEMFSNGFTEGVFQFESSGMKSVLMQFKPTSIEDLIAIISLYRPGPMNSIPKYIENHHNPQNIKYAHPMLESILKVTYGCIIYQEQVMQIFRKLAGYSLGRADIVRRAMSKKKSDVMQREREIFIHGLLNDKGEVEVEGCVRQGISESVASKIYDEMYSFASYAFNKSHAAAYAVISYRTAWLKCKYTGEYMAAMLTGVLSTGNHSKFSVYVAECNRLELKVLSPSVNEGEYEFYFDGKDIHIGLIAIKGLGKNLIQSIKAEREIRPFKSFCDFCSRMIKRDLNRRSLQGLIKSSALDGLGLNRRQMMVLSDDILEKISSRKRKNLEGQLSFFSNGDTEGEFEFSAPNVSEFSSKELLHMEKESTGIYISGHPVREYQDVIQKGDYITMADLAEIGHGSKCKDGDRIKMIAIVSSVRLKSTKNNSTMCNVVLEDMYGSVEMFVFSDVLKNVSGFLREGEVLQVQARVTSRDDEEVKLICEALEAAPKDLIQSESHITKKSNRQGLYIRLPSKESDEYKQANLLLDIFDGDVPVYFYMKEKEELLLASRKRWVYMNDVLLKELKHRLGDDNVVYVCG